MSNDDPSLGRFGRDVDKLFAELLGGKWAPCCGDPVFRPAADVHYHPRDHEVIVRLELPGIDPDRITLEIEGRTLRVSGNRPEQCPPDAVYHQMEISYGRFERLVSLPPEVDITRASADYKDGYLDITLPVKDRSQSRQIPISQNSEAEGHDGNDDR